MTQNVDTQGAELYFDDNRSTISGGRGFHPTIGLDISIDEDHLNISPIDTARRASTNIKIPKEDLPQFIEMLKKFV
jgi:hypothetical protein